MASFIKRGDKWRASVARGGQRLTGTFDTKREAQAWAAGAEVKLMAGAVLQRPEPRPVVTVADLFERYGRTVSPGKGSKRWEVTRLRTWPAAYPLFAGPVEALDAPALAAWRDARGRSVKPSTVNRELNLISAVLQHALLEWRVVGLTVNPVRQIKRPRNPPPRVRMITAAERAALCRQLGWDGKTEPVNTEQWIAWSWELALETACRRGEVLNLTWRHVHLAEQRLHLPKTKSGYARDVPLSTAAVRLFKLLEPRAPSASVVPVHAATFDTLFRRARDAAHLDGITFHDTRRAAATMLAAKLDSVLELASMTGHRNVNILRTRYYQPDASAIAKKLG